MTEETKKQVVKKANEEFAHCFNSFYTKEKCSHSGVFVDDVKYYIGHVAFFDFEEEEYTIKDENEMLAMFFEE